MTITSTQNARRRPSDSPGTIPTLTSTSKASTFHPSRSPAPSDPVLNISSLIHRAPTGSKGQLEALCENNDERVNEFLKSVEDSLRGLQKISISDAGKESTVQSTQTKLLNHFAVPSRLQKYSPSKKATGSSESHDRSGVKEASTGTQEGGQETTMESKASTELDAQRVLSEFACKKIQQHIIAPILSQEALKAFHPLVKHLPFRIAEKKIQTLRDLERVLFWLSPVRQFAQMISRQRDATAGKQVQLTGGLGQTGKTAELTYVKDGKTYSLRTGDEVDPDALPVLKRIVDEDIDDDVERSMARRKKNAPIEKTVHRCSECNKEFKRPCDLTKHEKTHSRPWKCSDEGCKYHEYGWPTEKERDRHFNDKHSDTPHMYHCQFHPCNYSSKRESNCKQHMEKAHGWVYSRTKSNGRLPKRTSMGQAPPTPSMSNMSTPSSHIFAAASPAFTVSTHMGSDTPIMDFAAPPVYQAPPQPRVPTFEFSGNTFGPLNQDFQFDNEDPLDLNSLDFDPIEAPSSWANIMANNDTEMRDEESIFGHNFDWANTDITSLNLQMVSPTTVSDASIATPAQFPEFSPPAQTKAMLPTPLSQCLDSPTENDFADFAQTSKDMGGRGADFELFRDHGYSSNDAPLFGDVTGDSDFHNLRM